jgi:hypothetical protein
MAHLSSWITAKPRRLYIEKLSKKELVAIVAGIWEERDARGARMEKRGMLRMFHREGDTDSQKRRVHAPVPIPQRMKVLLDRAAKACTATAQRQKLHTDDLQ